MRQESGVSRILIVDDDVGTLESFSLILRLRGFVVDTAATGQEGLARARRRSSDLLLTDLCLPDFSGIDVVRSLRHEGIQVPAIIMTAFATTSSAVDAIRLGVVDYIEKPLLEDEVVNAVDKALARREPERRALPDAPALPAIERWAELVLRVIRAKHDPRTLEGWAELEETAPRTLQNRCEAAGLGPKASLDFARMLRAVIQARGARSSLEIFLEGDPRTLRRLLSAAAVRSNGDANAAVPTPTEFLNAQRFISGGVAFDAIRRALARDSLL